MELRPCVRCRRHVEVVAVACPFCGEPQSVDATSDREFDRPLGRLGRAAIFAGAVIATPMVGCYVEPAPQQPAPQYTQPQPPPPPPAPQYPQPEPSPPPHFAQPPDPTTTSTSTTTTTSTTTRADTRLGQIGGVVNRVEIRQGRGGQLLSGPEEPAAGILVTMEASALRGATARGPARSTRTSPDGRFAFDKVAPGDYVVTIEGSPPQPVHVLPAKHVELMLTAEPVRTAVPVDQRHMAKPYGAPPARRRLV